MGQRVPPEMVAVSWFDGAIEQIKGWMDPQSLKMDEDCGIIANNQSNTASTVEQAADGGT
jgi:hypothetical protein